MRNAIIKDPCCVGIGEFGFDYSAHFSSYKTQQITLCMKFLQLFVKEELFSKVLVIHCRDKKGKTEASETSLKAFGEELPTLDRDVMKIHHHCFNRGITQLCNWLVCFLRMMFEFTAILLHQDRHPELEKVVQHLELDRSSWKWIRLTSQPMFTVSALITPLMVWKRWLAGWLN